MIGDALLQYTAYEQFHIVQYSSMQLLSVLGSSKTIPYQVDEPDLSKIIESAGVP